MKLGGLVSSPRCWGCEPKRRAGTRLRRCKDSNYKQMDFLDVDARETVCVGSELYVGIVSECSGLGGDRTPDPWSDNPTCYHWGKTNKGDARTMY